VAIKLPFQVIDYQIIKLLKCSYTLKYGSDKLVLLRDKIAETVCRGESGQSEVRKLYIQVWPLSVVVSSVTL